MVQATNSFLIRKQTFIVKNNRPIDEVYLREKKVSKLAIGHATQSNILHSLFRIFCVQKLGQGTYGEVSAATHRENGQKRAIKVIPRSKIRNWDRFQTEVKILQQLVRIKLFSFSSQ